MLRAAHIVSLDGLPAGIKVWGAPVAALLPARDVLDEADRAHAAKFKQQADRDRIIAARILLRHALTAKATHVAPQAWHFRMGPNGKPLMGDGLPQLQFNLSHAGEAVAVVVSLTHAVGIDIEPIAETEIIPDMLTPREIERLGALQGPERWREFMRIWTLKEACAKAMGLGLSYDVRGMDVAPQSAAVTVAETQIETATTMVECAGRPYALSVAWTES
jgi:4'-phosphopantetheinyl transferase